LPWSEGFRGCIGRRFAEVEMAAVVAALFSRHRCEIRRLDGEDAAAATRRATRALDESTMQMSFAVRTKIELVWYPRK
jgi:cytochrome P450